MSEERTAKGPSSVRELARPAQAAGRRAAESRATVPDVAWTAAADAPDGFGAALLAAVAAALRDHPGLNASHRDGTVVEHGRINLGVALDTGVPVLHDADTAADLADALERLRAGAAGGELTAAAFAGATFTVAGLDLPPGVDALAPWVTPGQVATLAAGAPTVRAVVRDGAVVARRVVTLTLVADARAVQGDAGPRFLAAVVAALGRDDP